MIRTKYLLLSVCVCISLILGVGLFAQVPDTNLSELSETSTVFAIPNDTYQIHVSSETSEKMGRKEFITKVRESIEHDPVVIMKAPPPVDVPVAVVQEQSVVQSTTSVYTNPPLPFMQSASSVLSSTTSSSTVHVEPSVNVPAEGEVPTL